MRWTVVSALIGWSLVLGSQGCGSPTDPESDLSPTLLERSSEVVLGYGDEVAVDGSVVRLAFGQVLSDSRCPVDAVCVWQGNAEVEVGIRAGMGPTIPLRMNTGLDPRSADWQGIRVTLVDLMPAPRTDVRIEPEDYSVRLKLEPLG
jgi:hypothetical protein